MECLLFFSFISSVIITVFLSVSPYIFLLCIILIRIGVSLLVGVLLRRFMGFLVFLVYVSGVQILFLFSLSVVPEELYNVVSKYLYSFVIALILNLGLFTGLNYSSLSLHTIKLYYIGDSRHWISFLLMVLFLVILILCCCGLCAKKDVPLRKLFFNIF